MSDIETRKKALRIANRRNLASYANDTKWAEFIDEIQKRKGELEIKFIDSEPTGLFSRVWIPTGNYIECGKTGPVLFTFIEWVRSQEVEEVSALASKAGLEYTSDEQTVTVFGYK